jgi:TPR repeat protein
VRRRGAAPVVALALALTTSAASGAAAPVPAAPAPTECDLLAAHPSDPDRLGAGVPASQVRAWNDAAIDACRRAVAAEPANARVRYNLGRALFYRGRRAEALPELARAADQRHRQSQFVLGLLYADGVAEVVAADACRALPLWRDAADRGHYAARVSLAHDWLRGRYARCERVPDRDTVAKYLEAALPEARKDYYQRLLVTDLQERLAAAR